MLRLAVARFAPPNKTKSSVSLSVSISGTFHWRSIWRTFGGQLRAIRFGGESGVVGGRPERQQPGQASRKCAPNSAVQARIRAGIGAAGANFVARAPQPSISLAQAKLHTVTYSTCITRTARICGAKTHVRPTSVSARALGFAVAMRHATGADPPSAFQRKRPLLQRGRRRLAEIVSRAECSRLVASSLPRNLGFRWNSRGVLAPPAG